MTKIFRKTNRALLLLNLFFLQSYLFHVQIGSYPSNLQEILIGLNTLAFFAWILSEKKLQKTIINIKNHKIISSFVLLTAISLMIVPIFQYLDFVRHVKFLFFAVVYVLIFMETFVSKEDKKFAIKFGGFGAILFGFFSVLFNLAGYNVASDLRLLGPLDAAVYLGFYFAPFFIFFTTEAIEKPRSYNTLFAIILGLLIIATRSMGTIGGTFIILSIFILRKPSIIFFKTKLAKTILVVLGIVVSLLIFYTKILPTMQTNYSSLSERSEIWKTSLYLLKKPETVLFGLGIGQFEYHYIENVNTVLNGANPLDYHVIQPHNLFFTFMFEYGILGLLLILMCIYRVIKNIAKNPSSTDIITIANYIVLYFSVHGLIDTPFFKNDMLILLLLFLEIALTKVQQPNLSKPHKDR